MNPTRTNDDLSTPRDIIRLIERMGNIVLDPCSNPWTELEADVMLSAHDGANGLIANWKRIVMEQRGCLENNLVFVNCPYSRGSVEVWADKIIAEAKQGVEILTLLKLDHSTEWSDKLRRNANARCDFHERISFDGGDCGSGFGMNSCMWYFGPRKYLFAHHFQLRGEIKLYDRD